ncbi:TPA: cation:proton antiporter [Streptococcus suis]
MVLSLGILLLVAYLLGKGAEKLGLPALIGMMVAGMILGPFGLSILEPQLLAISADLRRMALIVILLRAGMGLSLSDIKMMGPAALFMSFVPASFELLGARLLGPWFLDLTGGQAVLAGSILAAVSPAVVVPAMLGLIQSNRGQTRRVPQLVLFGAALDDVFVMVAFSGLLQVVQTGQYTNTAWIEIPLSILSGLVMGWGLGWVLAKFAGPYQKDPTQKTMVILSIAFILSGLEGFLSAFVPFSGLLAVMVLGLALKHYAQEAYQVTLVQLEGIWQFGALLLFGLVGASVDLAMGLATGPRLIGFVLLLLIFRSFGVLLSLVGSKLTLKEKIFVMIAYSPKATVQAAIGGIPLALGLPKGQLILTLAVTAILVTAPLGSWAIHRFGPSLLD